MCIGIYLVIHTGSMRVSVRGGQRVGTCFGRYLMFPPFFLVARVLRD